MPTFGSLFSGIGGLDLGLERAGWECKWQVEIDEWCQRVLEEHWPRVPRWRDVRDFVPLGPEAVDLVCGGFPCQDISRVGRRAGIDGEQSGLWSEFSRVIRLLRPRFVLVENSSSLTVHGLERITGDLAASGYDADWDCLPAAALGAPHIRDRLYLVAYASRGRHRAPDETVFARWPGAQLHRGWTPEPDVGRVANGIPSRVDRLRGLGNAVVPQVGEYVGRRLMEMT